MIVDWVKVWKNCKKKSLWTKSARKRTDPWEPLAKDYDEIMFLTDYPRATLKRVLGFIEPKHSVLEIGAGTGLLTIPIAKEAKHVTAVEPSEAMLRILRSKILKEGLSNISIIKERWESIGEERLSSYDVVLAAYSLDMADIDEALRKIDRYGRELVLIVHSHYYENDGLRIANNLLRKLQGYKETPHYCASYTLLVNILYQLGIHPNIEITRKRGNIPWDYYIRFRRLVCGQMTDWSTEIEKHIFDELKKRRLILHLDGKHWIYGNSIEALLWWKPNEKAEK